MRLRQKISLGLALVLAPTANLCAAAAERITLNAGVHLIHAEVMNTQEARMRGLMFRKKIGANEGMLFFFATEERHCMWMKNTLLPLSVAFIDERGVIVNIEDMQPETENQHCADRPVFFALEMKQGWFSARGIKAGSSISGIDKAPPPR